MSTRPTDPRAASRAEARRRARLAARGELPDDMEPATEPMQAQKAGGFVRRLFPAAPPLPGKTDPLLGFDRDGPLRPVRERLYLLRRNLIAWLVPGILAFLGFFASYFYSATAFGLIGTFVLFGSLIAAGWFGWQRPTLFGTAAALLSYVLVTILVLSIFASRGAPPETFGTAAQVTTQLLLQAAYQAGLGFLGGWYGGYLRRRQTQLSADTKRRR